MHGDVMSKEEDGVLKNLMLYYRAWAWVRGQADAVCMCIKIKMYDLRLCLCCVHLSCCMML